VERSLRHADYGNVELLMHMGSQTWATVWIKIHVAVHDDQAKRPGVGQDGPQRR